MVRAPSLEVSYRSQRADEGLLGDVLGIGGVACATKGGSIDGLHARPKELLPGLLVTGLRPANQLIVGVLHRLLSPAPIGPKSRLYTDWRPVPFHLFGGEGTSDLGEFFCSRDDGTPDTRFSTI